MDAQFCLLHCHEALNRPEHSGRLRETVAQCDWANGPWNTGGQLSPEGTPPSKGGSSQVIAYLREDPQAGLDLDASLKVQRAVLEREATLHNWQDVLWIEHRGYLGESVPTKAMSRALTLLSTGTAEVLAVSRVDRLSPSLLDFGLLVERSLSEGWSLVATDLGLDMTQASGQVFARSLTVFSRFERQLISDQTKVGMARKRAQGVRIGRPVVIPDGVYQRIVQARNAGMSYRAIAAELNADRVPTARGGLAWYPASIRAAMLSKR